jgi:AraC-like DNA-binding protein
LDYFEPEQRHIVVQVSRESLGLSDDVIRGTTGRAIAKGSPAREAFVAYAMTLMRPSGALPAAPNSQTSQLVTALVAAMIRSESEFTDVLPHTTESLLVSLQNFIRMNLSDPELSPDLLAAAHFISRRRLYEIFETVHDSPADAIRRMRVSAAAIEIREPREMRSIAEIAFAFGFADATTFTRSFRRYMGCTPREWRASLTG